MRRECDGCVEFPDPPCLKPGEPVRVTGGLLTGAMGLFAGLRAGDRVAVLLAVLGRVELPAVVVERAYGSAPPADRPWPSPVRWPSPTGLPKKLPARYIGNIELGMYGLPKALPGFTESTPGPSA